MSGFSREVLFKVGADASAVSSGLSDAEKKIQASIRRVLGMQTAAEKEYLAVVKQASDERIKAMSKADLYDQRQHEQRIRRIQREHADQSKGHEQRVAQYKKEESERVRAGKARYEAALKERAAGVADWRASLRRERLALGAREIIRDTHGVNILNLRRNVASRLGGHGGHGLGGLGGSGNIREGMVVLRELSSGNFAGAMRSLSILGQGWISRVAGMLVNPATAVIGGLGAGIVGAYKTTQQSYLTQRDAGRLGFSVTGYQGWMRQAGIESSAEDARSVLGHSAGLISGLASGNSGSYQTLRRWGIATTESSGALSTNEQIFERMLDKVASTADPARKAAMALDLFGSNYEKMIRTINEGSEGFQKAKQSRLNLSTGQTAAMAVAHEQGLSAWELIKMYSKAPYTIFKKSQAGLGIAFNPGLRQIAREMERAEEFPAKWQAYAERRAAYERSGRILPSGIDMNRLTSLNPELAVDYTQAQKQQRLAQAALEDWNKPGLESLADQARALTGTIHRRNYSLTPRMMTALKIQDMEEQSRVAWERGDDTTAVKLRDQALQMRSANKWLAEGDRNPLGSITASLQVANEHLKRVREMADSVLKYSSEQH